MATMIDELLERARAGDEQAFAELTAPYRRELQFHCYRMLGSLQDAEDMLQETLLAAWRALAGFEGRASLRGWLYRIATNRCLNAMRDTRRRPPPAPEPPFAPPEPSGWGDPGWLEPYPDTLLEGIADDAPGPEARYETRETVQLAFVAGLQKLPPRQRAALVLHDVLGFRAEEVAATLQSTEAGVRSALQRARAAVEERRAGASREDMSAPQSPGAQTVVARFADAFLAGDVQGLTALLTDDALLTMPPAPHEYAGVAAIAAFLRASFAYRGERRVELVPTGANLQPAFGAYVEDPGSGALRPGGLIVLRPRGDRLARVTRFHHGHLFARFGLPLELPV